VGCPYVDNPTDDNRNIYEHINSTFTTSVTSDNTSSFLQWCFIGADKQRNCCICDNKVGVNSKTCSQKDWHLHTSYGTGTKEYCSYNIMCSLTVKNIAMKYSGGAFVGEAVFFHQLNKTSLAARINVTIIHNTNKYTPYIISGSGALVGVILLVAISHCVVHVIKVRRRTILRRAGYQSISSSDSSPVGIPGTAILAISYVIL